MPSNPRLAATYRTGIEKTKVRPRAPSRDTQRDEIERCKNDVIYFVNHYCYVLDNEEKQWILFTLWADQETALRDIAIEKRMITLKARQLGISWLHLANMLHQMLFHPISEFLMFSQREDEAIALLERLKGMYEHLPEWMKDTIKSDSKHEWRLGNKSGARAMAADAGGDSRTVTGVLVDEADLVDDLEDLLTRAQPTLGKRGQLWVIGRAVKSKPQSYFKRLYRSVRDGAVQDWKSLFLGWFTHPGRDQAWYDKEAANCRATTGSLDRVHEQYPATDEEALSTASTDKRFPREWLEQAFVQLLPIPFPEGAPALPGLKIFKLPEPGRTYCGGADPAGGDLHSDDSVLTIIDPVTLEEVAVYADKVEPTTFAVNIASISDYYNGAPLLVERNNHGGTVLATLRDGYPHVPMRYGLDGKIGWASSNKVLNTRLYDTAANLLRDKHLGAVELTIHCFETFVQLASITSSDLDAPQGEHDDYADGWCLAIMCSQRGESSMQQIPYTGLYPHREQLNHPHMGRSALPTTRQPISSPQPESSDRIRRRNV